MVSAFFCNVLYHQSLFCALLQKIIIDGIRGGGDSGDAALDDFTFQKGPCRQIGTKEKLFLKIDIYLCHYQILVCSIYTEFTHRFGQA